MIATCEWGTVFFLCSCCFTVPPIPRLKRKKQQEDNNKDKKNKKMKTIDFQDFKVKEVTVPVVEDVNQLMHMVGTINELVAQYNDLKAENDNLKLNLEHAMKRLDKCAAYSKQLKEENDNLNERFNKCAKYCKGLEERINSLEDKPTPTPTPTKTETEDNNKSNSNVNNLWKVAFDQNNNLDVRIQACEGLLAIKHELTLKQTMAVNKNLNWLRSEIKRNGTTPNPDNVKEREVKVLEFANDEAKRAYAKWVDAYRDMDATSSTNAKIIHNEAHNLIKRSNILGDYLDEIPTVAKNEYIKKTTPKEGVDYNYQKAMDALGLQLSNVKAYGDSLIDEAIEEIEKLSQDLTNYIGDIDNGVRTDELNEICSNYNRKVGKIATMVKNNELTPEQKTQFQGICKKYTAQRMRAFEYLKNPKPQVTEKDPLAFNDDEWNAED